VSAKSATNGENYTLRDFSIELPANYQPQTAYPVFYGGGGCGGQPPQNGDGFGIGETGAIKVGLQYVNTCFADGGSSCAAGGPIANCTNGPEVPYIRAVTKWIEDNFCVNIGQEFIGGTSSGGWEAMTLGCGAANLLRGFVSVDGGKREHRWACTGPVAALMVTDSGDGPNPVGPLPTLDTNLDSYGSAPERDELLTRNGCVGTATAVWNPAYPLCQYYTGCPAAYPVVWCELGGGHQNTKAGTTDYTNAMWPFLSTLPAVLE
jgi:poly(3-hydroxybutyrate) depolymerase